MAASPTAPNISKVGAPKHSHVTPYGYITGFADAGGLVHAHGRDGQPRQLPAREVCVRRRFYRRRRPDGTFTYDVEKMLQPIENAGAALLRGLESSWPVTPKQRAVLSEFLGIQYLRGPAFRAWHTDFAHAHEGVFAHVLSRRGTPGDRILAEARGREIAGELAANSNQLTRMMSISGLAATAFGHMHWTLVRFPQPWLISCDQPIVLWPGEVQSTEPRAFPFGTGVTSTFELRFPISPRLAVLGTWRDDAKDIVVEGDSAIAGKLNAFTRAHADVHWFRLPGAEPPIANGLQWPLSRTLFPEDHTWAEARQSLRRRRSVAVTQGMAGLPLTQQRTINVLAG